MRTCEGQHHEAGADRDHGDRGGPPRRAGVPSQVVEHESRVAIRGGSGRHLGGERPGQGQLRIGCSAPVRFDQQPAATQPSATRTAVGPAINYNYGVLSVTVTVSGSKITKVGIASIDDYGSQRSQSIDEDSVPQLEQEALQAQSANIQGVSGASYTSQGFQQSLQGALSKLGLLTRGAPPRSVSPSTSSTTWKR